VLASSKTALHVGEATGHARSFEAAIERTDPRARGEVPGHEPAVLHGAKTGLQNYSSANQRLQILIIQMRVCGKTL
jgi:hypothetical protein